VIATGGTASAQTPDKPRLTSLSAAATARVPIGSVVEVTDARGKTISGKLTSLPDDGVRVNVGGKLLTVAAADVQRVKWHQADSRLNGLLIAAGIGAAPGVYWLLADPNECTGLCPEEYLPRNT
jgi:hypothetical protein